MVVLDMPDVAMLVLAMDMLLLLLIDTPDSAMLVLDMLVMATLVLATMTRGLLMLNQRLRLTLVCCAWIVYGENSCDYLMTCFIVSFYHFMFVHQNITNTALKHINFGQTTTSLFVHLRS